jgi:hypothetical protein
VRAEGHTGFWWGDLRDGDHLEDTGIDGEDNIKMGFQEVGWGTWTGSFVVMTGTGGGLLCVYETSASVKCRDFLSS